MSISVESNIAEIIKGLNGFERKQIPYILRETVNSIAFDFLRTMKKEISEELDIRKKAIPSSIRVKKATKAKTYAEIYVDEWSWQYKALHHHFSGGDRQRKGLEKALIYMGYMHKYEILTPPPGVRLRPSIYNQIISQLKLTYKAGYSANETTASRKRKSKTSLRFFLATSKINLHLAPGIYARMQGHDSPVCILRIAERPNYKKRFDMSETLKQVSSARGARHFSNAFNKAMRTAR